MEQCSVCLGTREGSVGETKLKCGHVFCTECVAPLLEKGSFSCPNCRRSYTFVTQQSQRPKSPIVICIPPEIGFLESFLARSGMGYDIRGCINQIVESALKQQSSS